MAGKPAVWNIEPHTVAKHKILEQYLGAWFPILNRYHGRIVYLDGFSGPGRYDGGEVGSPVIALNTAINHPMIRDTHEIRFIFIDSNAQRCEILKQVLHETFPNKPNNIQYEVINEEFEGSLKTTLDSLEEKGNSLAPTFAFIDPFGYSGIPMDLISRLLNHDSCEVMITFMSGFINRFRDEVHENAQDTLFGTAEWKKAEQIQRIEERIDFLLNLYINQLKERTGAEFIRTFRMSDENGRTIYDLVFATKHWMGMDAMKKSMEKVVANGNYHFSDKTGFGQTYLLDFFDENFDIRAGADMIFNKFKGKTVRDVEIRDFVLGQTPYRKWRPFLKFLESQSPSKINNVTLRTRRGLTYRDGCTIEFVSNN